LKNRNYTGNDYNENDTSTTYIDENIRYFNVKISVDSEYKEVYSTIINVKEEKERRIRREINKRLGNL